MLDHSFNKVKKKTPITPNPRPYQRYFLFTLPLDAALHPIQLQRPFDSFHIEVVLTKDLQIPKLISQAQLVVRLELVAVTGPTDALQIFPAVRIPCSQLPDKPSRNDVIDMATYS